MHNICELSMSRLGLCFPAFVAITFRMEGLSTPRGGKLLSRLQLAESLMIFSRTVPSFNPDRQIVTQSLLVENSCLEIKDYGVHHMCV